MSQASLYDQIMLSYIALAALAGFLIPLQALINARVGACLTGAISAALTNFIVGLVAIVFYVVIMRVPMPNWAQIGAAPAWAWFGGFFGAFFIFSASVALPKLGTSGLFSIIIAAQLIASVAFDHYGVLQDPHPITFYRIAGAVMLLLGVYLILKPDGSSSL